MSTSTHSRSESHLQSPPETPSARSHRTGSTERDFDSELGADHGDAFDGFEGGGGDSGEDTVHFCLLAEFDIDAGATLAHQYPYPTGTDEHRLAELMLPDGAHLRPEDWTTFYLGQTPSSAIDPMLAHEIQTGSTSARPMSMASSNPRASVYGIASVNQYKPGVAGGGLLYVLNCVRMKEDKNMRRGAMVKAMAICTPNPYIGIYKPLLLLALEEYFISPSPDILARLYDSANAISITGMPRLSRSERILLRHSERKDLFEEKYLSPGPTSGTREYFDDARSENEGSMSSRHVGFGSSSVSSHRGSQPSNGVRKGSQSSSQLHLITPPSREGRLTPDVNATAKRRGVPRDTHFFETEAKFKKITVPIRIPMTVFEEDVGDYSIIELVQAFSQPYTFPPPFHPHLHTNGALTHPVILILNAILAHRRVMFLGHGLPANAVARMVLAACALASGCGQILRGITESAFPYANLASLDILEQFSGFIAGVCNPRFEELPSTWDVLCNLETGRVTVSKDIRGGAMGSIKSGRSSEISLSASIVKVDDDGSAATPASKMNAQAKSDCVDNQFMDDILASMASHYGECHIRLRFTDYISRFTRLAAYQEFAHTGSTKIGYPSVLYRDGQLGSGTVFADESIRQREMWANGHRIDAWRRTKSYRLYTKDWARGQKRKVIRDFDVQHQIARLRLAKNMSDNEAEAIFSALANGVRSYDQVVELLTHLPPHWGGLTPIANGLFHRWPGIREAAVELVLNLQQYAIGRHAVAALNYFHRKTLLHLVEKHESAIAQREATVRLRITHNPSPISFSVGYQPDMALTSPPESGYGSTAVTPQNVRA